MKKWMLQNKLYFIGAFIGAIGGFLYWKYVGCVTGSCPITSKPLNSIVYFAFFGAVLLGSLKKKEMSKPSQQTT